MVSFDNEFFTTSQGVVIPGFGLLHRRPKYILRRKGCWVVNRREVPEVEKTCFSDTGYGSPGAALKAAIAAVGEAIGPVRRRRRLAQTERVDKETPTGIPGISYLIIHDNRNGQRIHRFYVSDPNTGRSHSVHIGTDNTYQANFRAAFHHARDLRLEFEETFERNAVWTDYTLI